MATATHKLTLQEFESQYADTDRSYEFWDGEAVPKGMPTWIHGLLQAILTQLFREAGLRAGGEVELRIDPNRRPKPDVIAMVRTNKPLERYPTEGLDYVVEIVSEDDNYSHLKDKCRSYEAWNFGHIIVVDPSDRSVVEWKHGAMLPVTEIAGFSVDRIWTELDRECA